MFLANDSQRSYLKVARNKGNKSLPRLEVAREFCVAAFLSISSNFLLKFSQVQLAAALGQFGTGAAFLQVSIVNLKQQQQHQKKQKKKKGNRKSGFYIIF